MSKLLEAYRTFHQQGFVPIFIRDDFDSKKLVEACVLAGYKCIEYTLRREDAAEMIPWIRKTYPDLHLLVGSTIDDDKVIAKMKKRFPQLLTVSQIDAMDVDGMVSMIGWSFESIKKYSVRRVIVPTAMTVTEALQQVSAGAHFIKLNGYDLDFVKKCREKATFDFCPILATGGMTLERIPEAVSAGVVVAGAGFDLILKGKPTDISANEIADTLIKFREVMNEARQKTWPDMVKAMSGDTETWLDSLPHYHPF